MACSHHVRQRKDGPKPRFISFNARRHDDQRAIGKGGTNSFGLSSIMSLSPKAAMQAVGVESFVTELAGAVEKANGAITRSPRLMLVTCDPTSSTMPIHSWPNRPPG